MSTDGYVVLRQMGQCDYEKFMTASSLEDAKDAAESAHGGPLEWEFNEEPTDPAWDVDVSDWETTPEDQVARWAIEYRVYLDYDEFMERD